MGEPKLEERYTYADYLNWDEGRWELINGKVYNMSPAPKRMHQDACGMLYRKIGNYLEGKPCKVYIAPFDVVLADEKYKDKENIFIDTVVQPDISVICDESKLDDAGCKGAPDFIIEILSQSTAEKDATVKKKLYEKNGVKEYWLVDTWTKFVHVYLLKNGKYDFAKCYELDMELEVTTLKGLTIKVNDIFDY